MKIKFTNKNQGAASSMFAAQCLGAIEQGQELPKPTSPTEKKISKWMLENRDNPNISISITAEAIEDTIRPQRTIDEVLKEVFSQSPLPNRLKTPKKRFEAGELGVASKISIVENYTAYKIGVEVLF